MTQITDNLMKNRLQHVILMGCPTFKLSHHKKGFSSNCLEIFDSNNQAHKFKKT